MNSLGRYGYADIISTQFRLSFNPFYYHLLLLQMLSDNLDIQESIIRDVKDRANDVLSVFPPADVDKAKVKLISLDQRFLFVKERLQRRQEEMLKSSVDWHEFECGLKSCLEWVLRAEERLTRELVDLRENETDIGRLKVSEEFEKPTR